MNKFWGVKARGNNLVTTREYGDIPNITKAPIESIYRPVPIEEAIASNALRASRFAIALDTDQFGPSFRGREFGEPVLGAYGERL